MAKAKQAEPAKENKEGEGEESLVEVDRVAVLESKLKLNRIIILIFSFVCFLFISVVVTGLVLLGGEVYSLPKDPLADMEAQVTRLDRQHDTLKLKISNHLAEIATVRNSVEAIDFNRHLKQVNEIERILLRQEKDYQYLLATLGNGVSSIANMLQGSKKWKSEYQARIEKAMEESKRREEKINNLINPEFGEEEY